MPWVKLDDGFYDNLTNRQLGPVGRDLFVCGLTYCAKGLTDGQIPKVDVPLVLAAAQAKPATVKALVAAGRWIDRGDHFEVDEYLTYQPSKAKVMAERKAARERQQRARGHGVSHGVTDGVTSSVTDGVSHAPPVPSRPSPSNPSSSSSSVEVDEDDRIEAAIGILADRDLDARLDDVDRAGPVRSHDAWRSSAAVKRRANDRTRLLELAKDPTLTADDLADALTRPAAPAKEEPVNTSAHIPRFVPEVVPKVSDEERRKMAADMAAMRANGLKREAAS